MRSGSRRTASGPSPGPTRTRWRRRAPHTASARAVSQPAGSCTPQHARHSDDCTFLLAYVHAAAVARSPSPLLSCDAVSPGSLMSYNLMHAGIATPDGEDPTDDISEKAKAGVDNVVVGVKDAVKKVTGGDN